MAENLFDELVKAAGEGRSSDPAALRKLAKIYGAESRAADEVAPRVLHGRFRFVPELGWMTWDGRVWDIGPSCEERARQAVREFIDKTEKDLRAQAVELETQLDELENTILARAPRDEVEKADQDESGKARHKLIQAHAQGGEAEQYNAMSKELRALTQQADIWLNLLTESKIGNVTKLSRRIEGVLTDADQLDQHPDLLNCHNGVVDLRSGELLDHDPDLLITHLAGGDYKPGAGSALWEKALHAVHPDIAEWFQTRMGQSITGHPPDDDAMVAAIGGGENGKTAVMGTVLRAVGTYGRLISHRVLISQPGQHPTELMDLRGLRFALLEETPEEGRLDTHQLKMTVGTPYITARLMRRDDVTFKASHTLWINTNFLPQVDSTDHGTWRRLKSMPWPFRFVKPGRAATEDRDRAGDLTLKPKLAQNPAVPAAVLAWLVEGAQRWYAAEQTSPQDPPTVTQATADWRATADVGLLFATECLTASPNHFITAETMRRAFGEFLTAQGKHQWSAQTMNTRFPESLAAAGILVDAAPTKKAKVRLTDAESRPPEPADDPWRGQMPRVPEAPSPQPGDTVRIWRGVRFKTPAERAAGHLAAVG